MSAAKKSDASAKFEFAQRVLADSGLSSTAKCVVMVLLLKFHNRRTGQTNPSLGEIANHIGLSRRAVIPAIAELKQSGWVDIESTKGGSQRNTNRYKFDFSRMSPVSPTSPVTGEEDCTGEEDFTRGAKKTSKGVKQTSHEPLKNPSSPNGEEGGGEEAARRRAPDGAPPYEKKAAFAEFWRTWQRGHGDDRERVRKAFAGAVAEHGADAILASAQRWAKAREPRYLPEPVKWLASGWHSEPAPKRTGNKWRQLRPRQGQPG